MALVLITIAGIGVAMLAMSIGVVLRGRCLRGSCGGPEIVGPEGQLLSCATCPHRRDRRRSGAD